MIVSSKTISPGIIPPQAPDHRVRIVQHAHRAWIDDGRSLMVNVLQELGLAGLLKFCELQQGESRSKQSPIVVIGAEPLNLNINPNGQGITNTNNRAELAG